MMDTNIDRCKYRFRTYGHGFLGQLREQLLRYMGTAIQTTLATARILQALLATAIQITLATAADHTISLDHTQYRLRIIQFSLRFLPRPLYPVLPNTTSKVVTGPGRNLSVKWNPLTTPDYPLPLNHASFFSPSLWIIEPSPSARPATDPGSQPS